MFIHNTSLPHVLAPARYSSAAQYELEIERLFRPAWHLVGSWADLDRDGAFVTTEILGKPVLVRNFGGELHAFLNVCTHRHALLTHQPRGCSPKLACQYHGWEYQADGSTAKIPDAQSFKPLPGGPECLQKFLVRRAGPLVFVNLSSGARELNDTWSPLVPAFDEFPAERWRRVSEWSYDFKVNWKIPVENTIESYHVPLVHPHTLVRYGEPEAIEHEIHDYAGIMRSPIVAPEIYRRVANHLLAWLEPGCSHRYRLYHGFPHLFLIRIDALLQVMSVMPLSPEACRMEVKVFVLRAARENLFTRSLTRGWGLFKRAIIRQILSEDAAIYPALQSGMNASPFHGRISAREELIYGFQEYVVRECGLTAS